MDYCPIKIRSELQELHKAYSQQGEIKMNSIYIGDRELDPPEDDEPLTCQGCNRTLAYMEDFDVHWCIETDSDGPEPDL